MMPQLGWQELLIVGLVVVLLFGTKKIPDFAKGLGTGIRNFKTALKTETADLKNEAGEVKRDIEKV